MNNQYDLAVRLAEAAAEQEKHWEEKLDEARATVKATEAGCASARRIAAMRRIELEQAVNALDKNEVR